MHARKASHGSAMKEFKSMASSHMEVKKKVNDKKCVEDLEGEQRSAQVPKLMHCSESPIEMNTQSPITNQVKQDTFDGLKSNVTESKKLNTKSPMAKGMSPISTKSKKSAQMGQLNKFESSDEENSSEDFINTLLKYENLYQVTIAKE